MDKLKLKRGSVKAAITRILNYCSGPEATEEGIRARCEKIDEYFKEFERIQELVEEEPMTYEQAAVEESYRTQVENTYYSIKASNVCCREGNNNDGTMVENSDQNNQRIRTIMDSISTNQSELGNLMERIALNTSSNIVNETPTSPAAGHHSSVQLFALHCHSLMDQIQIGSISENYSRR